jgi:hypothetical protein
VNRGRNWPQPAGGRLVVQKWHSTRDAGFRDAVMKDRRSNRDGGRIRPGINLQEESGKYGCSEGDN